MMHCPIDRLSISSPTDRTVARLTIRFRQNNRNVISHYLSFIHEYTEFTRYIRNAIDDNPYVSAKYTKCKADKASVSAEHTEFTSYTRIVSCDILKVTAEHTEFMGDTRNTIVAHSIGTPATLKVNDDRGIAIVPQSSVTATIPRTSVER